MENMCVSADILMPFNQIRYEHPHQIKTAVTETVKVFL